MRAPGFRTILPALLAAACSTGVLAQDESKDERVGLDVNKLRRIWLPAVPPPYFMDTEAGQHPNFGEWSPAQGWPHYDLASHYYGIWYRPRAFGLTKKERCKRQPWRPRGYGNLFNCPTTPHRMDYHAYPTRELPSDYGPSYYIRDCNPKCDCHDGKCCCKKLFGRDDDYDCEDCENGNGRKRCQVFTIGRRKYADGRCGQ